MHIHTWACSHTEREGLKRDPEFDKFKDIATAVAIAESLSLSEEQES